MDEPILSSRSSHNRLYRAYLLRLWCAERAAAECWRASLENSHTGERIGFASLEELFDFLMEESGRQEAREPLPRRAGGSTYE